MQSEAQLWRDRWKKANDYEVEELRSLTPQEALMRLEALYASIDDFGCREALREDADEVAAKWRRIKERYGKVAS
jgi:hypothetical protein